VRLLLLIFSSKAGAYPQEDLLSLVQNSAQEIKIIFRNKLAQAQKENENETKNQN
jgi:hypothetical protein